MSDRAQKQLIVTADDLGLHRGITDGSIEAHRNGIVTACSVVVNGEDFSRAAEELRKEPKLDVGIHLTLVEEKPLLSPNQVPSLLTSDGCFVHDFRRFMIRYLARRLSFHEIELELRAQIEAAKQAGLQLTHVNSHQHLHALPRLFRLVAGLAHEYGIGYIRVPIEMDISSAGPARRILLRGLNAMARRSTRDVRAGLSRNDMAVGVASAGHLKIDSLREALDGVEGTCELVVHPGHGDVEIAKKYTWGYEWDREREALCDPGLAREIHDRGIQLTRPSELSKKSMSSRA